MADRVVSDRMVTLALVLYSLSLPVALLAAGVRATQEDGFYYFKIAQQIARGAGSTFDGMHMTNGYHPLWLLCLVPLFWITPTPAVALTFGTILQGVLMAAGVGVLYNTARLAVGRFAASLAAMLWVMLTYVVALGGLEFSLQALGVLATAYVYLRWFASGSPPARGYLMLGLLLSMTFLARLDTILLAGVIGLFLAAREVRSGLWATGIARMLAFGAPLIVTSLGYVSLNLWLFGHALPVSGVVKRGWSIYLLAHDPHYLAGGWVTAKFDQLLWPITHLNSLYVLSLALGTFGAVVFGRRPWRPFILFSVLEFFSYVFLYHNSLSFPPWYYVIQPWLAVMLVASLVERSRSHRPIQIRSGKWAIWKRCLTLLVMSAIWCGPPLYTLRSITQWWNRERLGVSREPLRDAAQWVRANLPADAVVGAWNAGAIGYLSERRVVNLDGLVNSWDYVQNERGDLCDYWRKTGVTYLADVFENRQALSVVPTYAAYAPCADRLELIWSDNRYGTSWSAEVYRIRPFDSGK